MLVIFSDGGEHNSCVFGAIIVQHKTDLLALPNDDVGRVEQLCFPSSRSTTSTTRAGCFDRQARLLKMLALMHGRYRWHSQEYGR